MGKYKLRNYYLRYDDIWTELYPNISLNIVVPWQQTNISWKYISTGSYAATFAKRHCKLKIFSDVAWPHKIKVCLKRIKRKCLKFLRIIGMFFHFDFIKFESRQYKLMCIYRFISYMNVVRSLKVEIWLQVNGKTVNVKCIKLSGKVIREKWWK